jgi:hypothetical protein
MAIGPSVNSLVWGIKFHSVLLLQSRSHFIYDKNQLTPHFTLLEWERLRVLDRLSPQTLHCDTVSRGRRRKERQSVSVRDPGEIWRSFVSQRTVAKSSRFLNG